MHAVLECVQRAVNVATTDDRWTPETRALVQRARRQELQQTVRSLKPADRARLLDVITELIKALGEES
jgi:hypothetical protein